MMFIFCDNLINIKGNAMKVLLSNFTSYAFGHQ